MEQPKVSVIVPVYNAEKTLEKCVGSIRGQSYRNLEIILVNDGSRDGSLALCRRMAAEDSRILVIDKPNSGVSASRNVGIECAGGVYLEFADSDDYLAEDATGQMVARAEQFSCDLVITDFYRVINKRMAAKGNIDHEGLLNKKEFAEYLMKEPANYYYGVMWNKLYRRSLVMEYSIRCCTELNWCEDMLFNLEYLRYAESFSAIHQPLYYYVKNKRGLTTTSVSFNATVHMKRKLYEYYKELFESVELYDKHKFEVRRFFIASAKDGAVLIDESHHRRVLPEKNKAEKQPFGRENGLSALAVQALRQGQEKE